MRRYVHYLTMQMVLPTILITFSLTGIVWLTQVLRFIDFMLNRGLSMSDFLYLTGLMLPSLLLILLPISLAIAVIYCYQKLTSESELVVLSAVGVSRMQLAKPAILVGLCCAMICYALSLYIMPVANEQFRDVRTFFRDQYASILLEEEVFNSPIPGVTVFARARDQLNNLYGIIIHDNRDPAREQTLMADEGRLEQTPSGPRFYLKKGLRQEKKDGALSWLSFDEYALDIAFYGKKISRKREPDERRLEELFDYSDMNPNDIPAFRAEAHQRILWPLFTLLLPLAMLALLLSAEYNRRGQWKRVVLAVGAGAVIAIVFFGLRSLGAKQPWALPLMYLWVFVHLAGACWMLSSCKQFVIPSVTIGIRRKQKMDAA
jgi:lipopolysaccharide export system permease protein